MPKFTLSQDNRLNKKESFEFLFNQGKKSVSPTFILYACPKQFTEQHTSFIASKKIGNAVLRNKCKRKLKEIMRLSQHHIHKQFDIVLIARKSLLTTPFDECCEQFITSLQELSVYID